MKNFLRTLILNLFLLLFLALVGCSGDDDRGPAMPTPSDNPNTTAVQATDTQTISLSVSETTILPEESITLTATIVDESSDPVSGVSIMFNSSNARLGSLSDSSATTDDSGTATVTFTASADETGTVAFRASYGGISSSRASVTIDEAASSEQPTSISIDVDDGTVVMAGDSLIIKATLRDDEDVMGQGVAVSFSLNDSDMGHLSTATDDTNASGYTQTTFTAGRNEGTVTVIAESGGVMASINLRIMREQPATIQFADVTEQVIAIKGSGGVDFSTVRFIVKDGSGQAIENESVDIVILNGPEGGEYLGELDTMDGDIVYQATTDMAGYASVILHSGYVAGPVTLQASVTVGDVVVKAKPAVVSIGGGVVENERFDVAATYLNVYGLGFAGNQVEISAYLADRYGNHNLLDGTMVNFMTEQGLSVFSSSALANQNGIATTTLRTTGRSPANVTEELWEERLKDTIENLTGLRMDGHPRDGVCSILVYANGSEHFDDTDADGVYNADIDTFIAAEDDTYDDPFCDYDDDGIYDGPGNGDDNPIEFYFDWNHSETGDGQWDAENGVCDVNKPLFRNFRMLITGEPWILIDDRHDSDDSLSIQAGDSAYLPVFICDRNYNPLIPGTKITFSLKGFGESAEILGLTEFIMPTTYSAASDDKAQRNMIDFSVHIADMREDTTEAVTGALNITVSWNGNEYYSSALITLEAATP